MYAPWYPPGPAAVTATGAETAATSGLRTRRCAGANALYVA
jgi:hypothetical protein